NLRSSGATLLVMVLLFCTAGCDGQHPAANARIMASLGDLIVEINHPLARITGCRVSLDWHHSARSISSSATVAAPRTPTTSTAVVRQPSSQGIGFSWRCLRDIERHPFAAR